VGIGILVAPVQNVVAMSSGLGVVFSLSQWRAIATPHTASYHPALAVATVAELLVLGALTAFDALLIELFFRKKRSFPTLFCAARIASTAFAVIDDLVIAALLPASQTTEAGQGEIARSVLVSVLWVAYMRTSKRVAATFVQ
jgi:hypothetical protein